jgi:hypothetical protein
MLKRTLLTLASVFFLTVCASAAPILYQNGTLDGNTNAFRIGPDIGPINYAVSNSFVISSADTLTGVTFGSWAVSGSLTQVDWILSTGSLGAGELNRGTSAVSNVFQFTNGFSSDVYLSSFALPNVSLAAGTYFLTLLNPVGGSDFRWDQAAGPTTSSAETEVAGSSSPIPSGFFFITGAPEIDPLRGTLPVSFCLMMLLTVQRSNRRKSDAT